MWINEYDEEKIRADFFEDGYKLGFERGFEQGLAKVKGPGISQGELGMLVKEISLGYLTVSQAADLAGMTETEFTKITGL